MAYGLVTPCSNCPFRTDVKPYLRRDRVREILSSSGEFYCHKTIKVEDDGEGEEHWGYIQDDANAQVCAGFLICLEHEGRPNQMMRIAERLGAYTPDKLRMDAPVYLGISEAVRAHRKR